MNEEDDIEGIFSETQKHLEEADRLHRQAAKSRKEAKGWILLSFGILGAAAMIDHFRSKKA